MNTYIMYSIELPRIKDLSFAAANTAANAAANNLKAFDLIEKLNKEKKNFDKITNLQDYYKALNANNPYTKLIEILKVNLQEETKVITNAFIKMYEILNSFNLLSGETAGLFIAELPGSFIEATRIHCARNNIKFKWAANSYKSNNRYENTNYLEDYYRMYEDNQEKWFFGSMDNGDLTLKDTIRSITQDIAPMEPNFMTGDAKYVEKNVNWDKEEIDNIPVITGEFTCVLNTLKLHGNAVIKLFTFCEIPMLNLLHIMCWHFKQVFIFKPLTSRPANSEIYLICIDKIYPIHETLKNYLYQRSPEQIIKLPISNISGEYYKALYKIQSDIIDKQITALREELKMTKKDVDTKVIDEWLAKNKLSK